MTRVYYIYKNLPSEFQDMLEGPRIVSCENNILLEHNENIGEGPYSSLKELKEKSKIYSNVFERDKKRAEKILLDRFIVKASNIILFPEGIDNEYEKIIYRIMQHSKNGSLSRRNVSGIHIYDSKKIKILRLVERENQKGVFSAEIEVLNERTNKWIKKESVTTFFPVNWNLQKLIIECYYAYKNKVKTSETEYIGKTLSGIKVCFNYNNSGIFKTLYPLYD
jgi:hypothetical protein